MNQAELGTRLLPAELADGRVVYVLAPPDIIGVHETQLRSDDGVVTKNNGIPYTSDYTAVNDRQGQLYSGRQIETRNPVVERSRRIESSEPSARSGNISMASHGASRVSYTPHVNKPGVTLSSRIGVSDMNVRVKSPVVITGPITSSEMLPPPPILQENLRRESLAEIRPSTNEIIWRPW